MSDTAGEAIHIVGAGPAGLAAALTVARAGRQAIVHEQRQDVGSRFHGDLQGIENWTTRDDALDELRASGIDPSFGSQPFCEAAFYDPEGREYTCRSPTPMFYLVRRGREPGTLDQQLKAQALAAGVEIRFRDPVHRLPQGGIVAGGPRGSDAIVVGYVFETHRADGVFAVLSDRLAPRGYAYLLVSHGRGTVATCLFEDFHREKLYLERTIAFFQKRAGLAMRHPVRFGGTGNVLLPSTARHGNILFAGEAAGFQDALWGFGIRIAMLSGHLAAQALLAGAPADYDRLWRRRLGDLVRVSIVNRYLFDRMEDRGYVRLMRSIGRADDTRQWLRRHYGPSPGKRLLLALARRAARSRRAPPGCTLSSCDCTWCREHSPSAAGGQPRPETRFVSAGAALHFSSRDSGA
jgi:flavin-dependent dehydrogenase